MIKLSNWKSGEQMFFFLTSVVLIFICLKTGYWRNWKQYYSTTLFVLSGNLIHELITNQKPLWNMGALLGKYFVLELFVMTLLYAGTIILFLTYYPKLMSHQIVYILLWAALYVVIELASLNWCGFTYSNGWNIYFSIGFDIIMFTLIRVHYKKPLVAWASSGFMAIICIWTFKIPLGK